MRTICFKCLRPIENCFCRFLKPFDPGVKYVFLMHPKEAKHQRTGTGRIAHAGLLDSEIIMGIDFTKNDRLCELLSDEKYFPVLLYPNPTAYNAKTPSFKEKIGNKKLLAIIIDSTWFCSKKMLRFSTNVSSLPKISFYGKYESIFTFKKEPTPECVSTIETCYYLNKELKSEGIICSDENTVNAPPTPDFDTANESLMDAFKELIKFQLKKENDRVNGLIPNTHFHDWKYTKTKEIPEF